MRPVASAVGLRRLFEYVSARPRMVQHIYSAMGHAALEEYLMETTRDLFMAYLRDAAELDVKDTPPGFLSHYLPSRHRNRSGFFRSRCGQRTKSGAERTGRSR